MTSKVHDIAIVGGGIIGLATAMALVDQLPGISLLVLEKEDRLAAHQTGHNSGVIHSGLYYRPGSLKAQDCVAGRDALYEFCARHQVPFERCGKVVVAVGEKELPGLAELERRGRENGLAGIERLDSRQLREYEPHVAGISGLWVPETGIVDYRQVTEAYARVVKIKGGEVRLQSRVRRVRRIGGAFALDTPLGTVRTRFLVNCAGLQCDRVARLAGARPELRIIPFRGEYYQLTEPCRQLVRNLIYPVPDPNFPFLGVHLTRMIDGRREAGPNAVLALKREGYSRQSFSIRDMAEILSYPGFWRMARRFWRMGGQEYYRSFRKSVFARDLRRLVPELEEGDLAPGGAGVRAQAVDLAGNLVDDFRIVEAEGMVHVLNAPSPAATASISIGRTLARKARQAFAMA